MAEKILKGINFPGLEDTYIIPEVEVDDTLSISGASADAKATGDALNDLDRTRLSLVPYGTSIASNKDLNTAEFIKVGNYYCSANATAATLSNCPTNGAAFMMLVYSPLSTTIDNESTGTWVYRLRKIITLHGDEYVQLVSSGATAGSFSYGKWKHAMTNVLSSEEYGTTLPTAGTAGRIFFKKV